MPMSLFLTLFNDHVWKYQIKYTIILKYIYANKQ